jgi:KaiC/GvpD/RAD55 family RecA-like ATPase
MSKMFSRARIFAFAAIAVLSFLLLNLFPFYPLVVVIILALALGAISLEFPSLGLLLALLLSVLGAFYQNPYAGLLYLIVFVLATSLTSTWLEMGFISASWILALSPLSAAAIAPTVAAGLHSGRQTAVKVGALSAITLFLLAWSHGVREAGLMLIMSPATYLQKAVPNPWEFALFIPKAEAFDTPALTAYFGPLAGNLGDVGLYALIATWALAGYVIALLSAKWRGPMYFAAAVVGLIPALAVSGILARAPVLQLAAGLVSSLGVAVVYRLVQAQITIPGMGIFRGFEDLVPTGIPPKYTLLLGSPVNEERNLTILQFLLGAMKHKAQTYLLTTDITFAQNAKSMLGDRITVIVANPRATAATAKDMITIPTGVENLTSLNIELVKAVKSSTDTSARVCLDVFTDIILAHKLVTARKWVTDLVPRLEGWGFAVMGALNPSLHSNEEVQGLLDLFSGYVEVVEKDFAGKKRLVIGVRKMAGLTFNENELLVDRRVLGDRVAKAGVSGLRARLAR